MGEIIGKWKGRRYTVLSLLGKGGFGTVFKVKDERGNIRALKISKETMSITREYYTMKKIECIETIPKVYDFDDWEKEDIYHFIVMDYIEGEDLKSLAKRNTFSQQDILKLGVFLINILNEFDRLGYKYADIKLENITISDNGDIYLVDFGGVVEKSQSIKEYTPCYNMLSWTNLENNFTNNTIFSVSIIMTVLLLKKEFNPLVHSLEQVINYIKISSISKEIKEILIKGLRGDFLWVYSYRDDILKLIYPFDYDMKCNEDKINYYFIGSIIFFVFALLLNIKLHFF